MLGTAQDTKTDEFSENFQKGGGGIFNQKNYVANVGPLDRVFWTFYEHEGVGFKDVFPKIHPFWYPDPSQNRMSLC